MDGDKAGRDIRNWGCLGAMMKPGAVEASWNFFG